MFDDFQVRYVEAEMLHITECLSGQNLFNLSDRPIEKTLDEWINKGSKYNPYVVKSKQAYLKQFDTAFVTCVNKIFKRLLYGRKAISSTADIIGGLRSLKLIKPGASSLIDSLSSSYRQKRSQFNHKVHHVIHTHATAPDNIVKESFLNNVFKLDDGRLIVESDKKLGFVVINESTYREAYTKINEDQHFAKADITEDWYIKEITDYLHQAELALPSQLSKILKPKDFKVDIDSPSIGTLRLLPKVQKLQDVSYASVHLLKCRGIKSAMNDPIQVLQLILDKIYSHLLNCLEQQFMTEFGRLSPSVTGVQEALDRLKGTASGSWGRSVQLDADFSNMYSNCNATLLKESVRICAVFAGFSEATIEYIENLITVNMEHSYFHEPTGFFHTTSGFSMGDHSASRGSELILRTSELGTYRLLRAHSLLELTHHYFRFKDDVEAQPEGTREEVLKAIEIISTSYPQDIQLNVEVGIIQGKFLNLRIYTLPTSTTSYTTILRKRNSKYDVIPPNSNTCPKYKSCAGRTYFDMTRTHCSDPREQERQVQVVKHILHLKGYRPRQIKHMRRRRQPKPPDDKLYTGKIEFDNVTKIHKYLRAIFADSELDPEVYNLPMAVPGKKLLQYVFTLKKLRTQLNF